MLYNLCIVFYVLSNMHFILCIDAIRFIPGTVLNGLYYLHYILCIVFYDLYSMYCILCIVFYTLYPMHYLLCIFFLTLKLVVTDRQTDRRTLSHIELLLQLKISNLNSPIIYLRKYILHNHTFPVFDLAHQD